jgi:hypothetical protein
MLEIRVPFPDQLMGLWRELSWLKLLSTDAVIKVTMKKTSTWVLLDIYI